LIDKERIRKIAEAYPERYRGRILEALESGVDSAMKEIKTADFMLDKPTHPILSHGTPEQKREVPQEAYSNRVSVGSAKKRGVKYCLYQPHNYRLYLDFNKEGFQPRPNQAKRLKKSLVELEYKTLNFGAEHFYRFENYSVRVKKNQLQVASYQDRQKWYRIPVTTSAKQDIKLRITKRINRKALKFARDFTLRYGGKSSLTILSQKSEDPIIREEFIDALPMKDAWHMPTHKKVYNEKKVEFYGSVFAGNYIESQALHSVAPEIEQSLIAMAKGLQENNKVVSDFAAQIKKHLEVLGSINMSFQTFTDAITAQNPIASLKKLITSKNDVLRHKEAILRLSQEQKAELSEWLVDNFK